MPHGEDHDHAGDKESILFRVARSLPKLRNKDAGR
jgi:hypothetical protein